LRYLESKSRELIINSLKFLFEKAEMEGLWFYNKQHEIWFSPKELRKEQDESDEFIWGVTRWRLRDPDELLEELYMREESIQNEIQHLKSRMSK
jgi:hypothetical protein